MSKGLVLGIIVLAVLAAGLWYMIEGDGDNTLIKDIKEGVSVLENSQTPTEPPSPKATEGPGQASGQRVPAEFQSGNSRFSRGSCTTDTNCTVGGCSGEVCSSDPGVITTCEFSPNFPGIKRGYACGCLPTKVCGWR